MAEENFQFKRSEMPQNEEFLVKAHSILHHVKENFQFRLGALKRSRIKYSEEILIQYFTMIKEYFQFRSIETHQNLRFCVKSD